MVTAKLFGRAAALAALVLFLGTTSSSQSTDYGPAKVAYDDYIKRPSLQMRSRGRYRLAQTGDIRAMKILYESYAKKYTPQDQEHYLITSITAKFFSDEAHVPIWKEWREKYPAATEAWLWYRSLMIHGAVKGDDELLSVAKTHKELFIRAAAIEAMAENNSEKLLPFLDELCAGLGELKGIDRIVMTETAARCLYSQAFHYGTDLFRKPAMKLIDMLDDKDTNARTKLVIARYLRETLGGDNLWINAKPWHWKLLNPNKPMPVGDDGKDGRYAEPPKPKFVGVEAAGSRIAYVIDLSDSMMTPFTAKEKEEIKKPPPPKPRGPVTGGGEGGKKEPREEPKKEEPKAEEKPPEKEVEDDMPWDKIKCRFHVAREYLKLSLKGLLPDQFYCVIVFGTQAKLMNSTKGLIQATPAAIQATIKELDMIKPGPPTAVRKHGVLMGDTNLHGGIHRAFKVRKTGMGKEYEYVDPAGFTDGADTVFILSDGDPTDDDWAIDDKRDKDDQTGDPETNVKAPDQPVLNFPGPYGYFLPKSVMGELLTDDVRRLNLFRKCEIHCIGIGEVSAGLLSRIAECGMGECKMVGKQ